MVDLVYTNKSGSKLEHIVSKRDDDELRILRSLLDVGGDNRDLFSN